MSIDVQVFAKTHIFISRVHSMGVKLLGPVVTMFNHLRNCQTPFQSDCTVLSSRQQRSSVLISPHHYRCRLALPFVFQSHLSGCEEATGKTTRCCLCSWPDAHQLRRVLASVSEKNSTVSAKMESFLDVVIVSHQVWEVFSRSFFWLFFSTPVSPLWHPHYTYAGSLTGGSHFSKVPFRFLHSCLLSVLRLMHDDDLCWCIFEFADSFPAHSYLLLRVSSELSTLFVVLFKTRISFLKNISRYRCSLFDEILSPCFTSLNITSIRSWPVLGNPVPPLPHYILRSSQTSHSPCFRMLLLLLSFIILPSLHINFKFYFTRS